MNITDVSGIGDATAQQLKTHGFDSVEDVAQASIEQLAAVPGIGEGRAAALRESARGLLPEATAGKQSPEAVPAPAGDAEEDPETVTAPDGDGAGTDGRKDGEGKKGKKKGKKRKKDKGRKRKKNKRQ